MDCYFLERERYVKEKKGQSHSCGGVRRDKTRPWILRRVLGSGKCFWILGSVSDSGKCFWILRRVLDSGTCFVPTSHRTSLFCFLSVGPS